MHIVIERFKLKERTIYKAVLVGTCLSGYGDSVEKALGELILSEPETFSVLGLRVEISSTPIPLTREGE